MPLQSYLKKLLKEIEITDKNCKKMGGKSARIATDHDLPIVHKDFDHAPKFISIIGTYNSSYYC